MPSKAATDNNDDIRTKLGVTTAEELVDWLNILVYGDPGVGKTMFSSTAQDNEDTRPILFLDIDGGLVTIRNRKDIDVKAPRSIKEVETIFNTLYMDTSGYYKTVVIDSLTELQKLDMRDIMKEAYNAKPDTTDVDVPSPREWGKSLIHMTKIVRAFRDLPCHTIFTCLKGEHIDETTNVTNIFPALPGKQQREIPGYIDIVGYYRVENVNNESVRRMQFAKTKRVVAKDRTQKLGDFIDSPTIPMLWEIVSTGEKEKK